MYDLSFNGERKGERERGRETWEDKAGALGVLSANLPSIFPNGGRTSARVTAKSSHTFGRVLWTLGASLQRAAGKRSSSRSGASWRSRFVLFSRRNLSSCRLQLHLLRSFCFGERLISPGSKSLFNVAPCVLSSFFVTEFSLAKEQSREICM